MEGSPAGQTLSVFPISARAVFPATHSAGTTSGIWEARRLALDFALALGEALAFGEALGEDLAFAFVAAGEDFAFAFVAAGEGLAGTDKDLGAALDFDFAFGRPRDRGVDVLREPSELLRARAIAGGACSASLAFGDADQEGPRGRPRGRGGVFGTGGSKAASGTGPAAKPGL